MRSSVEYISAKIARHYWIPNRRWFLFSSLDRFWIHLHWSSDFFKWPASSQIFVHCLSSSDELSSYHIIGAHSLLFQCRTNIICSGTFIVMHKEIANYTSYSQNVIYFSFGYTQVLGNSHSLYPNSWLIVIKEGPFKFPRLSTKSILQSNDTQPHTITHTRAEANDSTTH